MRKAMSESVNIQQLKSALVRGGVSTYPMAMQAIAEFRHEVFSMLKRVAKRRATALSQIVGGKEFEENSEGVDDFLDGLDTYLSIFTEGPFGLTLSVAWLDVGTSPDPVCITAGIWCEKRATFERVSKALQDKFGSKITLQPDDYECYLEKPIQRQQVDKLESELGRICDAWIRMLRSVNVRKLIGSTP